MSPLFSTAIESKWEKLSPRERDAWVAKDVVGWRHDCDPEIEDHEKCWGWVHKGVNMLRGKDIPDYSTDDSQSLDILKQLTSEGWYYTIDGGDTHVEVNFYDGHAETFTTIKSTLAEALCLSALKLRASGVTPIARGKDKI